MLCHFFVATVLGLASDLILVVVKIRFRCVFWIYWTLAFRKKLVPECNPSTPNISYHKGGWRGKCWKQPFCINELWTNKIHEFERSENHFVPNVLSVKKCEYNLYMICLSDPPLCAIFLCKRNFLTKAKCFSIFEVKNAFEKLPHFLTIFFFGLYWKHFGKEKQKQEELYDRYKRPSHLHISKQLLDQQLWFTPKLLSRRRMLRKTSPQGR